MPIIFKYKNPINLSYAPGIVIGGEDGDPGKNGKSGTSIFFSDFEFNNSYDTELALQKIENGYVLSSNNFLKLPEGHRYKENDLILSTSGMCYRIISVSEESTFKNYTYDIEYLGHIQHKETPVISYVEFTDITDLNTGRESVQNIVGRGNVITVDDNGVYTNDGVMRGKWYSIKLVGTNNSLDRLITTDISSVSGEERDMIEKLYKSLFEAGKDTDNNSSEDSKEYYRYSLEIKLANHKSFNLGANPIDKSNAVLNFYKSLKYSNLDLHKGISNYPNEEHSDAEELLKGNLVTPLEVYISDNLLDRMRFGGDNNIYFSYDKTKSMSYKSGINSNDEYTKNSLKLINDPGCTEIVNKLTESNVFNENYVDGSRVDLEGNPVYNPHGNSVYNLPMYSSGKIEGIDSSADIDVCIDKTQKERDEMIQKQAAASNKNKPGRGSSVYFSSMPDSTVLEEIDKFLFSENNKFIVTIKNLKTKETSFIEVPAVKI